MNKNNFCVSAAMLAMALSLSACTTMNDDMMATSASAGETVMVGGAAMYPNRNIVENAVNSRDHTTLVAAVKAAGLVDTLSSAGPFTVFAPTNAAFAKLPAGTVDTLLQPANQWGQPAFRATGSAALVGSFCPVFAAWRRWSHRSKLRRHLALLSASARQMLPQSPPQRQ